MRKVYIILLGIFSLSLTSCNDWLNIRPETEQKEEDQFASYKGFRDALTGCYMSLANTSLYGEKLSMSHIESLANLWYQQNYAPTDADRAADYYLALHDYDSDEAQSAMQNIWSELFYVIAQANMIIKYADENPSVFETTASRAIVQGEAYAIRAYCQLDVLRLFGQMPQGGTQEVKLPYSETTAFDEYPTYYDYKAYIDKLEDDLNKAEGLLKDNDPIFEYTFNQLNYPSSNLIDDSYLYYRQSRFNYWAVKGIQARMYLYTGQTNLAYQAAKAILDAKDVNGNPVIALSGSSDIVSNGYKACPNECLLYLSKYNLKSVTGFLIGGNSDIKASSYYLYLSKEQLTELFSGESTDSHNRYRYLWNQSVKNQSNQFCATLLKYYFTDDAENQILYHQIIPMLRLSEIYLIAIETTTNLEEANELFAEYMLEHDVVLDTDAFSSLNDIQKKLIAEYRREFFAEGQMFYTYKRLFVKKLLTSGKEMSEKEYILMECLGNGFNA